MAKRNMKVCPSEKRKEHDECVKGDCSGMNHAEVFHGDVRSHLRPQAQRPRSAARHLHGSLGVAVVGRRRCMTKGKRNERVTKRVAFESFKGDDVSVHGWVREEKVLTGDGCVRESLPCCGKVEVR